MQRVTALYVCVWRSFPLKKNTSADKRITIIVAVTLITIYTLLELIFIEERQNLSEDCL